MEWRDHCGEMRGIERDKDTMENTGGYEYRGYEGQRRERIREENISGNSIGLLWRQKFRDTHSVHNL